MTGSSEKDLMSEEARAARREYQRKYRRENPERVREWAKTYWERKAAEAEKAEGE